MALDTATYLVTREIAMRSGVINSRYRIADGRFVLSNKDLALVRLTSDEFLTGLQGVERVSEGDAQRLIAENKFQRGLGNVSVPIEPVQEEVVEAPAEEETLEETLEAPKESEETEEEQNTEE